MYWCVRSTAFYQLDNQVVIDMGRMHRLLRMHVSECPWEAIYAEDEVQGFCGAAEFNASRAVEAKIAVEEPITSNTGALPGAEESRAGLLAILLDGHSESGGSSRCSGRSGLRPQTCLG